MKFAFKLHDDNVIFPQRHLRFFRPAAGGGGGGSHGGHVEWQVCDLRGIINVKTPFISSVILPVQLPTATDPSSSCPLRSPPASLPGPICSINPSRRPMRMATTVSPNRLIPSRRRSGSPPSCPRRARVWARRAWPRGGNCGRKSTVNNRAPEVVTPGAQSMEVCSDDVSCMISAWIVQYNTPNLFAGLRRKPRLHGGRPQPEKDRQVRQGQGEQGEQGEQGGRGEAGQGEVYR